MLPELSRHALVWLSATAWHELVADAADADARELLTHWQGKRFPLVVCRQPPDRAAGSLALGLPVPLRWSSRRLALRTRLDAVVKVGCFPSLIEVGRHHAWAPQALALDQALADVGVTAQVHGSHGWQLLTGEACLREGSDIDLCVRVPDFGAACAAVSCLESARWPRRLDGELIFWDGIAVAWREFAQLASGQLGSLLVKRLDGVRLVPADVFRRLTATAVVGLMARP